MFFAVLRRADKHLHQVIVQAIEDLPLEGPLKLRIVKIAGMQLEIVGMDARLGEARPDYDLDSLAFSTRIELHQGMLVEPQLLLDSRQAIGGHRFDSSEILL